MSEITIEHIIRNTPLFKTAALCISENHYLHTMPDPRTSFEVFMIRIGDNTLPGGLLVFGRPEACQCQDWYGKVDKWAAGKCEVTNWQVLNLARVFILPKYQAGGSGCREDLLPGFRDRRGTWHSTLASTAIREAIKVIGFEYLRLRPPCFLEEPYEIRWLLSYCDTHFHKGTIYREAGFEFYETKNKDGKQTWRARLPKLTAEENEEIKAASARSKRAQAYRGKRSQMRLEI
jgi:hypothetical protein